MQGMSLCSSEGNKIIEKIDKALETSRIMKDVECFSHLDRYTGSEDGESGRTNRKTNGRTGNPGRAGNLSGI